MRRSLLAVCLLVSLCCQGRAKPLEIYFIDVEGGQATLLVSPSGQSLLVDAGWPGFHGRDAARIVVAAEEARVKRIDYLLVTHYHADHVGGVPQLAEKIRIGTFVDHGPSVESGDRLDALLAAYRPVVEKSRHVVAKPGDLIPIKGIDVRVLTAAAKAIQSPLVGAVQPNPLCAATDRQVGEGGENPQSVGILIRFGRFRMIDLGDLTWNKELELVCPGNRVGKVDVYLTTHHCNSDSGSAAIVHALAPRVAIVNNGTRKGGAPSAWQIVRNSPGLDDIWQLHRSVKGDRESNAPESFIANPEEECRGRAIKLVANADGSFTVTNARNGFSKRYNPR